MTTNHTPAPWTIQPAKTGDTLCMIRARLPGYSRTSKIAEVTDLGAQGDANAHLIAAAPELLDAMRTVSNEAGQLDDHGQPPVLISYAHIIKLRDAIAKAEGRA